MKYLPYYNYLLFLLLFSCNSNSNFQPLTKGLTEEIATADGAKARFQIHLHGKQSVDDQVESFDFQQKEEDTLSLIPNQKEIRLNITADFQLEKTHLTSTQYHTGQVHFEVGCQTTPDGDIIFLNNSSIVLHQESYADETRVGRIAFVINNHKKEIYIVINIVPDDHPASMRVESLYQNQTLYRLPSNAQLVYTLKLQTAAVDYLPVDSVISSTLTFKDSMALLHSLEPKNILDWWHSIGLANQYKLAHRKTTAVVTGHLFPNEPDDYLRDTLIDRAVSIRKHLESIITKHSDIYIKPSIICRTRLKYPNRTDVYATIHLKNQLYDHSNND